MSDTNQTIDVLVGILVLGATCWIWYGYRLFFGGVPASTTAQEHDGIQIIAAANHKGGVGKTTVLFHLVKWLTDNTEKNLLVVDASLYGDLTNKLCGPKADLTAFRKKGTIESMVSACLMPRSWLARCFGWGNGFDVRDHMLPIKSLCPDGPENLFLMTTSRGWQTWRAHRSLGIRQSTNPLSIALPSSQNHTDVVASVATKFRSSLAADAKEWVVVVDTDGGEMHDGSKLGLALADTIVLPLRTDLDALPRLCRMLDFLSELHDRKQSHAFIKTAFFNQVPVGKEEACTMAHFTPRGAAILENMEKIRDYLIQLAGVYPRLLPTLHGVKTSNDECSSAFFTAVRDGGVTFTKANNAGLMHTNVTSAPIMDIQLLVPLLFNAD